MPRTWNIDDILRKPDNVSVPCKQASMTKYPIPYQATQPLYTTLLVFLFLSNVALPKLHLFSNDHTPNGNLHLCTKFDRNG